MLKIAFKEWAVVCKALAEGRQALILRKGGIAEVGGEFRPEHARFWLYPTYLHEHKEGIQPSALPLLDQVLGERAPAGVLRLSHFAEVSGVYHVMREEMILGLDDLHIWSAPTVRMKFHYRKKGVYVLPVRVYRAAKATELPETAEYAGCRSWVELGTELPTDGATPVLGDRAYADLLETLDRRLNPVAFA